MWTLVKPGIDAHRAAVNTAQVAGSLADARTSMTTQRVVEMVSESIPGAVVQMMALFATGGDKGLIPILSILSSIATCGAISVEMSYSFDSPKEQRKSNPGFYGYLPASLTKRASCMAQMFLFSIFNLVVRSLTCVILAQRVS